MTDLQQSCELHLLKQIVGSLALSGQLPIVPIHEALGMYIGTKGPPEILQQQTELFSSVEASFRAGCVDPLCHRQRLLKNAFSGTDSQINRTWRAGFLLTLRYTVA